MKKLTVKNYEDAHEYMMRWYDHEDWTDLNLVLDDGQTDYAAYLLWTAGAFKDPDDGAARECIRIAKAFNKLSRKKQDKIINESFNGCRVHECEACGLYSFVNVDNRELYDDKHFKHCYGCGVGPVKHSDWKK